MSRKWEDFNQWEKIRLFMIVVLTILEENVWIYIFIDLVL
jgi:hypothetical protein